MKKIDSEKLVCSFLQSKQLIEFGILPLSVFCYEQALKMDEVGSTDIFNPSTEIEIGVEVSFEFAGEYMGQDNCVPAFTMEEAAILIGGNFPKPDMYSDQEWQRQLNMIHYPVYMPKKQKTFANGAGAMVEWLIFLLTEKKVTADECNKRLEAFYKGSFYNPLTEKLKEEKK